MSDWAAKRFWNTAEAVACDGGFEVLLDGRRVKTPAKTSLILPTAAMADRVAQEWQAQGEKIDPMTMPFTRSANAALDKVAIQKVEVAGLIAAYGENDLLCYRATSPSELMARQAQIWDPLLDWAKSKLGVVLTVTQGVMNVQQPANSIEVMRAEVSKQDSFALTALHDLVSISGSLVIGLAAQQKAFDLADLWAASRLDEEWQIEQWGRDEDADAQAAVKESAFIHARDFYDHSL